MNYNGEQSPARDKMNKMDNRRETDLQDCDWLAGLIDMMADHNIITMEELEDYAWRANYDRNSQED